MLRHMRTVSTGALLLVTLGLITIPLVHGIVDTMCTVVVETVDVNLPLSPSDHCGQSSVTVTGIVQGSCSNNGNNCVNWHLTHLSVVFEQFCIPKLTTIVTGTVNVQGDGGCSVPVTYRFANVTECQCQFVGYQII